MSHKKTPFHINRFTIFTSLPAFLSAEIFFAGVYFLFTQIIQWIYFVLSMMSTATIEANMALFSPINIVIFIVSLVAMSVLLCLEIATIIAITAYDYYRDDHIPLKSLIQFSFRQIRQVFRIRTIPFFLCVFFFPKEFIGPKWLFSLNIPPFIIDELIKTPSYQFLFGISVVGFLYLLYRLLFVIHYIFLDQKNVRDAMIFSWRLTKNIGHKKMGKNLLRYGLTAMLFTLPTVAIFIASSRFLWQISPNFWEYLLPISTFLNVIAEFLFSGLPGVVFLSGLTVTFLQESRFYPEKFSRRFTFLKNRPENIPRWKNVRHIFSKKIFIFTITASLILMPVYLAIIFPPEQFSWKTPLIISHRGKQDKFSSENTISAIKKAKKVGADMVEIDVYQNRSGTLILSHDDNLKRVANANIFIKNITDDALQKISLKNGEKVPTLDSVLEVAKKEQISLIIEPKVHGNEKNLYENLVSLIEKHEMIGSVYIHSFHLESLEKIKKLNPHLRVWYIVFGGLGKIGHLNVDFFSIQETVATRTILEDIHFYEKKAFIWTVNEPDNVENYMKLGADGIITDDVQIIKNEVKKILKNKNPSSIRLHFFLWNVTNHDIEQGWNYIKNHYQKWKNSQNLPKHS